MAVGTAGALLFLRFHQRGAWIVSDFLEGVLLSIVILGMIYCFVEVRFAAGIDPAFFSMVCLFLGLLGFVKSLSDNTLRPIAPEGLSGHTFFVFLALSAFSLSFVFSILFLTQDYCVKTKLMSKAMGHLPPLELTGRLNFTFFTVGTAALSVGVLSGILYFRSMKIASAMMLEPTVILTLALLVLYGIILALRVGPLERSRRAAVVSIVAYSLLLVAFSATHTLAGGSG